jgi:hypothetical protein
MVRFLLIDVAFSIEPRWRTSAACMFLLLMSRNQSAQPRRTYLTIKARTSTAAFSIAVNGFR